MAKRVGPITLDGDAADRITLLTLKECRSFLKKELAAWRKNPRTEDNPEGVWMHPDDVADYIILVEAMNKLIKWFDISES